MAMNAVPTTRARTEGLTRLQTGGAGGSMAIDIGQGTVTLPAPSQMVIDNVIDTGVKLFFGAMLFASGAVFATVVGDDRASG